MESPRPVAPGYRGLWHNLFSFMGTETPKRIAISILIGVAAGLGAVAFFTCLEWLRWFCLGYVAGAPAPSPAGEHLFEYVTLTTYRPWVLFLVPVVGGLLSGFVVYTWAPEAEGDGTDAMIDAFHNYKGNIRTRVPFIKAVSSILTLASGGSAGREGPITQIGAGFGSWLSRVLHLTVRERRIFLLAGCAAGLGAIFRAPLGAAITSVEVPYKEDFESEAIIPCIISSVIAYSLFCFVFDFKPVFATPHFTFHDPRELLIYAVLGLICAPVGTFYVRLYHGTAKLFRKLTPIPRHFRPALGGVLIGTIALFVPQAIGGGYGYIQMAILGKMALEALILAALFKIIATSITIGSGGSGGVFGPTLFIGGMLGGVVGALGHLLFPTVVTQPGAYVLVGMAAFFAGAAKAPLGALFMVSEMTWSYELLPPLMLVSVISVLFNHTLSVYNNQLTNTFASPAHEGDVTVNALSQLTVNDVFSPGRDFIVLHANTRFRGLREAISKSGQSVFPVVDASERFIGLLSLNNVRTVLFEASLHELVVVGELATRPISLTLDQNLYDSLLAFLDSGYPQVPVVAYEGGRQRILGMVNHSDVIAAYHREVSLHRKAE